MVKQVRGKNLFFSTDVEAAVRDAEIIFVSVSREMVQEQAPPLQDAQ